MNQGQHPDSQPSAVSHGTINSNRLRPRLSSARPTTIRPYSSKVRKVSNRTEILEDVYGILMNKKGGYTTLMKLGTSGIENGKVFRSNQELAQENLHLKKQMNKIQQQLTKLKSKYDALKRITNKQNQQLKIQFSKEQYWTGSNNNMLRGIKHQYSEIKQRYEDKCKQLEDIVKELAVSHAREDKTYIGLLEKENHKLLKAIDRYRSLPRNQESLACANSELMGEKEQLKENIESLRRDLKIAREEVERGRANIGFLEKLMIEKDNTLHHVIRKLKNTEAEKTEIVNELAKAKQDKEDIQNKMQQRIRSIEERNEKQFQAQLGLFFKENQTKETKIAKLEKEIAYLTTILSYWKPLDEPVDNLADTNKVNFTERNESSAFSITQTQNMRRKDNLLEANQSIVKVFGKQQNREELDKNQTNEKQKRVQQTADKKHSEASRKCRRVVERQLEGIGEILRYRCFGLAVTMQQVQACFDWKEGEPVTEEEVWKKQYITMKEAQAIVSNPQGYFRLGEEDAELLSRFLIEDSKNEHVYCDPNNQNIRSIVKSIIRNIIGEYQLPDDAQAVSKSAKELIQKYRQNLESQFRQTVTSGIISKKKITDAFTGFGMQTTEQVSNYLFGKLALHPDSININQLRYSTLFNLCDG